MEGTMKLTQPEACEAMRAYLERRGALPAHGKVKRVSKDQYADEVQVDVEVGEAPVAAVSTPTCPKCEGSGMVVLADVPGEGRIGGGPCPCGAKIGGAS